MKKILMGFALVAVLCAVGTAGYRLGQHLAHKDMPVEHDAGT